MVKKKHQKTNAIRIIEQNHIDYEESEFPWSEDHIDAISAAEALGVKSDEVFKTLVTLGNKTGPVVAVIPGNEELDLKALAKASGNKKMEMLPLKELEATTGYIRGGCSPIGMKKVYPTYLAVQAKKHEKIYVSAGRRGKQVRLKGEDLLHLVHGQYAQISHGM